MPEARWPTYYCAERTLDVSHGGLTVRLWLNPMVYLSQADVEALSGRVWQYIARYTDWRLVLREGAKLEDLLDMIHDAERGLNGIQVREQSVSGTVGVMAYFVPFDRDTDEENI